MKHKTLAMLLAAVLAAGSCTAAFAEEAAAETDEQEFSQEDNDWHGGPRGNWRRGGPGRDGWRRDRHDRGNRRGPRNGRDQGYHGFRHGFGPGGFGGLGFRGWEDINLDDAQKARLVDVLTANFRARLEARMAMNAARRALWELEKDEDANTEALIAAHAALGEAEGRMQAAIRKSRKEVKAVFTPEQLQKLEERRKGPPPHRFGDRKPGGKNKPRG